MFLIEDEMHAEMLEGEFNSFNEALNELRRISKIPWDKEPNCCPCTSWKTCQRNYQIIEYDTSEIPWKELKRVDVLNVSAKGTKWIGNESESR